MREKGREGKEGNKEGEKKKKETVMNFLFSTLFFFSKVRVMVCSAV